MRSVFILKNQNFKDIILNLLNFILKDKLKEDVDHVYIKMLFLQKSFDNFNISKN